MRVLIIGGGGREHALAHKISEAEEVKGLFIGPGNAGTAALVERRRLEGGNVALRLKAEDGFREVREFCRRKEIDLVVVGPEKELAEGLVDQLEKEGIAAFGPNQAAAQLEASKAFAKEVMRQAGVPTAAYEVFTSLEKAQAYLKSHEGRVVLKADGLSQGKGVLLPQTREEALKQLEEYFVAKRFKQAGETVLIEEFLEGEEASVLGFCDGTTFKLLPAARDHKRAYDEDEGPNTGGMGVYTPVAALKGRSEEIGEKIFQPVLREMARRGTSFKGMLYVGLMIKETELKVLEFNVRFGDPEAQCLLPLLKSNLVNIMQACIAGKLADLEAIRLRKEKASVTVVLASGGYPKSYETGRELRGLISARGEEEKFHIFEAGTKHINQKIVTSGGRVLAATGIGANLAEARERAYAGMKQLSFEGAFYRRDIGRR